jgi:hypothetical protein
MTDETTTMTGTMTGEDASDAGGVNSAARDLVAAADDWLAEYVEVFDPLAWRDTEGIEYRRKAFSELALYLYVADEYEPDAPEELRSLVVERGTDERFVSLLRRNPAHLPRYAPALTYLLHDGEAGPTVRSAVERALTHPAIRGGERPPNRDLDVARLAEIVDVDIGIDATATTERSMLAAGPAISRTSGMDAYALTHDVLFCADFGVERYTLSDLSAYDVGTTLDGFLLRFVAAGHTDLALELLACGVVTGQLSPSLVGWTLDWILDRTDVHGHVPGPESVTAPPTFSGTISDDEGADPEDVALPREWLEDYHTNLVAGIVGRLLLHRGDRLAGDEDDTDGNDTTDGSTADWDDEALSHLGAAFDAFADYDLKRGSKHVVELCDLRLPPRLYPLTDELAAFLRSQRRDDGTFGFWTDERRTFQQAGHDIDAFERGPLARTTEACRAALNALEDGEIGGGHDVTGDSGDASDHD